MVDGEDRKTLRPLRPAAPIDGPLAESGAVPGPATRLPRPRRPWLRSTFREDTKPATETKAAETKAAETKAAEAKAAEAKAAEAKAADEPVAAKPVEEPTAETKPAEKAKPATGPATETKPATATSATGAAATASGAKDGEGAGDLAQTKVDLPATKPAAGPRRRRVQFAHAVRQPPHRVAIAAARATRDWSRRPSGRLTLPGVFLLALVAATAAAGALLVPATARGTRPVAVDATSPAPTADPQAPLPGGTPPPGGMPPPTQTALPPGTAPTGPVVGGSTGRPSDALAGWAAQVGPKVGISPVAMQAYGYAEVVLAQTNRSCGLSWTTLAAIGFVESGHGQANGATLRQDGKALPEIIGLPLDGQGGRMRIPDTDRGVMDKDPVLDRAVGPMQFIPTTWQEIGADADNDGVKDPHDLDDAALAAGNYLCKGSRNLTIPADWWNAILSYNDVRRYAQDVYDTANRYGQASRT
ncbi:lytic transglycosylase domain-containing protein [Micromonospora sp. MSM11]|nr:lytic transglycosylase domain-containing protein [Micromonospora sp. MSM11]MCL7458769.1 lytic transglycosylase domain-containing protein [Micromonospora sp. MSM11]